MLNLVFKQLRSLCVLDLMVCEMTEFDEYDDGSVPVSHYKHKGKWYAKPVSGGTAQRLNIKGIHLHGRKWRVQQRKRGQLRR